MTANIIANEVAVDAAGNVSVVEIDGRIFVHNSLIDEAFGMGVKDGQRKCWDQVNALIKTGGLGGNGC